MIDTTQMTARQARIVLEARRAVLCEIRGRESAGLVMIKTITRLKMLRARSPADASLRGAIDLLEDQYRPSGPGY